jgi:hypothetical protein
MAQKLQGFAHYGKVQSSNPMHNKFCYKIIFWSIEKLQANFKNK